MSKDGKVKVEMKVYGLPFQNSKGYNIGRVTHRLKGSLPYTETDQIDHFLYNLYGWASKQSLEFDERTQKKIDNANKDFKANYFQSFDKSMDFIPIPGHITAKVPNKTFKDSSIKIKEGKLQIGEPKEVLASSASSASNASNRTSSSKRKRTGGGKKTRKSSRSNKSKTRKKK